MTDTIPPSMTEFSPPSANAARELTADVTVPAADGTSVVHQAYPLRQPMEEATEILVRVRGSTLRRVRKRLVALSNASFPWPELLLCMATLAAGGVLGAIASDVTLKELRGKLFYLLLPPLAVGCGVAYGMLRFNKSVSASAIARDLLDEIPDPDKTT